MLATSIIEQDSLERVGSRVRVSVRIPWYRALPLSSISDVRVVIDGTEVPHDSLTWTVDGVRYRLDELPEHWDRSWYVLDSSVIEGDDVSDQGREEHEVDVTIGLYIPYLPAGPGVLQIREQDTKTLTMKEAE
ncbi:MAG: DUF6379 domain-containing protein [Nocardioides sp.]|uniref:C-glycoside deglycosidase beta subunit domain-containing protein n=1 Tax=Nocardioides sp. TaxID=35761 RepID=UPI0039E62244